MSYQEKLHIRAVPPSALGILDLLTTILPQIPPFDLFVSQCVHKTRKIIQKLRSSSLRAQPLLKTTSRGATYRQLAFI